LFNSLFCFFLLVRLFVFPFSLTSCFPSSLTLPF
jgi:hypothetical protein